MSEAARAARERAIESLTSAAMRAAQPADGTTAGAAAKRRAVAELIAEGVDELLIACAAQHLPDRIFAADTDGNTTITERPPER